MRERFQWPAPSTPTPSRHRRDEGLSPSRMGWGRKLLAATLAGAVLMTSLPVSAQGGMIGTDELVFSGNDAWPAHPTAIRDRLTHMLAREDVRSALVARGVDASVAQARVNALSDAEAVELAGRIDELPAGGDPLGVLFSVFIVLLITDILGLTKVFPFTRSVR